MDFPANRVESPVRCRLVLGLAPGILSNPPHPPPLSMPITFREWAVTVRALAEGEQLLTLRKGGIREPEKHFKLDHERFFLYPTFDHQYADLVRESHRPVLERALEEGVWSDGEPPPNALLRNRELAQPDRVR